MPSIVPAFEYDIFISYRHNDNRSGWVTEFAMALQEELAATIKESISVYFDTNPHDGLLETHNVDKSLERKLKCLIFIPIISQTYCDTKSFAWQHEFCVFNKLSQADQFGRDIELSNGNVASRILPIKIHDLDEEDKASIENEIGGVLRSIEFIFKSAGVNRPLRAVEEHAQDNFNKTFYRDQINKTANAIKEIIISLKNPVTQTSRITSSQQAHTKLKRSKKIIIASIAILLVIIMGYLLYPTLFSSTDGELTFGKSIAVLPFVDMSAGKDQEYLGDGISEAIINALTNIKELKVIGRTSSFQFKGEKVDLREVGAQLQVGTVLEGSVMKSGNKIRITAQLINVEDGTQIWSERYDRELQDVFFIQDEIASKIAQKLALSLKINNISPSTVPTTNMEAYEMTMKGKFFLQQGPTGAAKAKEYFQKALELDSNYSEAQMGIAATYIFMGSSDELIKSISRLKSLHADPIALNDLMMTYYMFREGNWKKSKELYDSAMAADFPSSITYAYYEASFGKNMNKAINTLEKVVERDPLFLDGLRNLTMFYLNAGELEKARKTIDKMVEINSSYIDCYLLKAETYLREGKFSKALKECSIAEDRFKNQKMFLSTKIKALAGAGKISEARKLFYDLNVEEDPAFRWALANFYFPLGLEEKGFEWLNAVAIKNPPFIIYMLIDSNYDPFRNDTRYKQVVARLNLPE